MTENLKAFKKLEYLVSIRAPCQKIGTTPRRYSVTIRAENSRFKGKVYIDVKYNEKAHVLH